MDSDSNESTVRRRRKLGPRTKREATPDPASFSYRRQRSTADVGEPHATAIDVDDGLVQSVCMQIRPPASSSKSAHQSKILRRRDKSFADAASRSHSQPRQAERLSSPEAFDLLRTVKRSLSSPRHKEDSSESELMTVKTTAAAEMRSRHATSTHAPKATADENLSRLELNLRRFEQERKRLEAEKRLFEREKREHKLRHRQMLGSEERKLLLQTYRKHGDRKQLLADVDGEDRRRLAQNRTEQQRTEPPSRTQRMRSARIYDESSTQFSSSDADVDDALRKHLSPVRRHAKTTSNSQQSSLPPPQQPKKSSADSRNDSLSPIRPQRRSKTPEQPQPEAVRKSSTNADLMKVNAGAAEVKQEETQSRRTDQREYDDSRRRRSLEKEAASQEIEVKRRQITERRRSDETKGKARNVVDAATTTTTTCLKRPHQLTWREKIAAFFGIIRKSDEKMTQKNLEKETKDKITSAEPNQIDSEKILSWAFLRLFCADAQREWRRLKSDYHSEWKEFRRLRRRCVAHTVILILLCGFGGLMFRYTEGSSENIYKCEVRKVKRDFIDNLWTVSHNMREDDWKSLARQKLRKFEEELHRLQLQGVRYYPGQKSWNFVNCILYCWTVITRIGYGHITPKTTLGRSLTIVYAIIGIPMFLILLADFGKLFTRGMKVLWAYVRRLYYTGTCRKIRKQQQVRDAMSSFNTVYNMATGAPSYFFGTRTTATNGVEEADVESQAATSPPGTPTSPYPETFEVDDEFNLPILVATSLLVAYILIGAFVYTIWEDWTYFEAFYFVFISMSTIGFGDLVPNHPIFMMCSIIYLIFGLALTSMFINVVQIKLSDTFKHASAKIGATIGLGLPSEVGDEPNKTPSDVVSANGSRLDKSEKKAGESTTPTTIPLSSILRPARPTMLPNETRGAGSDNEADMPPLLPRRQVSMENQPNESENKKKKRFFK